MTSRDLGLPLVRRLSTVPNGERATGGPGWDAGTERDYNAVQNVWNDLNYLNGLNSFEIQTHRL